MSKATAEFKGFGDWVELFRAGTHTDSRGNTRTWSAADLDSVIANHDASNPAPLVIGHPKEDAPAYGWSAELKRDGELLLGKFRDVNPAVDAAAKQQAYRNRSIKLKPTATGFKLVHVGLLGAAPPAIEGLAPVYSASDEGQTYEFSGWYEADQASLLSRVLRRIREFLIEKEGADVADRVMPEWDLTEAERIAAAAAADAREELAAEPASPFAATPEGSTVSTFSQADIDAAVAAARTEEAAKTAAVEARLKAAAKRERLAEAQQFVSSLISDEAGNVRLTPAEAEGLPEALAFMAELDAAAAEFTFSAAADGAERKVKLYEFMRSKLTALAPRMKLGKEQAGSDAGVDVNDAVALAAAASEFQAAEEKAGRAITIAEAVSHVSAKRSA